MGHSESIIEFILVEQPSSSLLLTITKTRTVQRKKNSQKLNFNQKSKSLFVLASSLIFIFLTFCTICSQAMRLDPERIAARMRIEEEIEMDKSLKSGRNRRQLGGTPKEQTIQVTAPLFSGRLFDYGPESGDKELLKSLDVGKRLQLTRPVSFYGKEYPTVFILGNGAIGFEASSRSYRPKVLPSSLKLVAPFWNRNDLRLGGSVYYREITSGRVLERGQSEIRYQYDHEVKVQSAIIVTWDGMQPIGDNALPAENTNTFQAALFITSNGTYANFIYKNIGWTQGAEAGFSAGDEEHHFTLPTSGTGNIMYLEDYGNTGIPGEWMFILGKSTVIRCKAGIKGDTCDETCSSGEWGPDCTGCCHCKNSNVCNVITGECGVDDTCSDCWTGGNCQHKSALCKKNALRQCTHNAISYTDLDRCGDPIHRCECIAGYEGNGFEECLDIDECSQPGTCHEKAICTNTPGHYFCQCISGFSGDGVSDCIASFLYPYKGGEKLPKTRNSKIIWELKYPLKMFGQVRHEFTISSNGIVIVKELHGSIPSGANHLEDMELLGLAPFFAPIDLSTGTGEITVQESTNSEILTRASQLINQNLGNGETTFRATNVLIISFINVTSSKSIPQNTFQTLLIGGTNQKREILTFVQFLYKDLIWSDSAEAGIMTTDKSNSIHLPGSGTAGIEQLSQLSNIRSPGIWLYRIDEESVSPCIQPELQPPYCDAPSPTLINSRRPSSTTQNPLVESTTKMTSKFKESSPVPAIFKPIEEEELEEEEEDSNIERTRPSNSFIKKPKDKHPSFKQHESSNQESAEREQQQQQQKHKITPVFPTAEIPRQHVFPNISSGGDGGVEVSTNRLHPHIIPSSLGNKQNIIPQIVSTSSSQHKPIVTIHSEEIENMPRDVFETFPPSMTLIPQLFTNSPNAKNFPNVDGETKFQQQFIHTPQVISGESNKNKEMIEFATTTTTTIKTPTKIEMEKPSIIDFVVDSTNENNNNHKDSKLIPLVNAFQTIRPELDEQTSSKTPSTTTTTTTTIIKAQTSTTTTMPPTTTTTEQQKISEFIEEEAEIPTTTLSTTTTTTNGRLFVFTTIKSNKSLPTKSKTIISPFSKQPKSDNNNNNNMNNLDQGIDTNSINDLSEAGTLPFDPNRVLEAEASGSKSFMVITVMIVAVWLIVLVIVSSYLCCQRRRKQITLRAMYGPAYQIRPIGQTNSPYGIPTINGKPPHTYESSSYEDHLEKAARLSSEMNAFNPSGRISLYGSYWNLSSSTNGISPPPLPSSLGISNRTELAATALAYGNEGNNSPIATTQQQQQQKQNNGGWASPLTPISANSKYIPFTTNQRYGHNGRH